MTELTRQCLDELKDIFVKMSYALVDVKGGTRAFHLLIGAIIDKYPAQVGIDAMKELLTEIHMKQIKGGIEHEDQHNRHTEGESDSGKDSGD